MNHREFIKLASKFVREWNGHLEIFSLLQVIENSRQYLLLRTDIFDRKQSLSAPDFSSCSHGRNLNGMKRALLKGFKTNT